LFPIGPNCDQSMNPQQKRNQLNSPEKEHTRINPLYQNLPQKEEDLYEPQYNMYYNNESLGQNQGYIPSPYSLN
jgi:hypothetical protein